MHSFAGLDMSSASWHIYYVLSYRILSTLDNDYIIPTTSRFHLQVTLPLTDTPQTHYLIASLRSRPFLPLGGIPNPYPSPQT
jgi:hypothetical protein